jgi:CheY-like chemotaxis protein
MDGIELCQQIRESSLLEPKPVVVALTAETSESLHHRCEAVGIAHILYKPISSHQFKSFFESTFQTLRPCNSDRCLAEVTNGTVDSDDTMGASLAGSDESSVTGGVTN